MPQPTSRINPKTKKPKGDALTWKRALILAAVFAATIGLGRAHKGLMIPLTVALAGAPLVACVDALHGRKKQAAGLLGAVAWVYLVGLVMPLNLWLAIGPLLALIWSTWAIGRRSIKRTHGKIADGFKAAAKQMPPGAKQEGKPTVTGRLTRTKFSMPTDTPAWEPKKAAFRIAAAGGMSAPQVDIVPLHEDQAGLYELVVRTGKPFDFEMPAYPTSGWPEMSYPLGCDGDAGTVWISMKGSAGKHYLIAGRNGSGKSNTMQVITNGLTRIRLGKYQFENWFMDPHEEFGDFPHVRRSTRLADAADFYDELTEVMRWRLANRDAGFPPIHCLTDESPSVLANKKVAAKIVALAQEGRKVGIVLGFGVQNPKEGQFPTELRSQMSMVIAHRVKDTHGTGVILGPGAVGEGWNAHKIRKQGRGILELEFGEPPRQYVQVFEAPTILPSVVVAQPAASWAMPMPPAEAWPPRPSAASVRPPSGGDTQGEQAADTPADGQAADTPPSDLEARILSVVGPEPKSGRAIAKEAKGSPDGVNKALKRLKERQLVRETDGRWIAA